MLENLPGRRALARLRTPHRLLAAIAVLFASCAIGLGHARPAAAKDAMPTWSVPSEGGSKTFPGFTVNGFAELTVNGQVDDPTPKDCLQAAYCDYIPVDIAVPGGGDARDFIGSTFQFDITWNGASGDLDTYAWYIGKDPDDPQSKDTDEVQIAKSAGGTQPESFKHGRVRSVLLIFNYQGIETDYTIKVTTKFRKIVKPTEKPEVTSAGGFGGGSPSTFPTTTTSIATDPDTGTSTATTEAIITSGGDSAGGSVAPPGYARTNDAVDLSGKTRVPIEQVTLGRGDDPRVVAGPSSTASVVLILGAIPLGILSIGAALLRFRPSGRVKVPDLPIIADPSLPAGSLGALPPPSP